MKKIIIVILLIITSKATFAQNTSAGKIYKSTNKDNIGKSFTLGSDNAVKVVMESLKAYNSLNLNKFLSYGSTELYDKKGIATQKAWFDSLSKVEENPMIIFPIRVAGSNEDLVYMIAEENREYKNGSKEKLYVLEINKVNEDGKLTSFNQFKSIPKTNEFGKTTGGRVYGANGDTSTLSFTNRGEVELVEKLKAAFNNMDGKACVEFFTDSVTLSGEDGQTYRVSNNFWLKYFDNIKSINWEIGDICPTKITDTDPVSGITIRSNTKTVLKDGTVKSNSEIVIFQFELSGKIGSISIWSKPNIKRK